MSTLSIENISAGYGQALAIRNVTLSVMPGEVVALLGRNGAGKSTTLKAIMGMLPLRTGSVAMDGAEQQMLALARTLMGNPRMLLLDEPSEGLAPVIVDALAGVVRTLKGEGLGILLCEQNTSFTNRVADRAAIIESGSLQYEGSMDELALDDTVRKRYLAV